MGKGDRNVDEGQWGQCDVDGKSATYLVNLRGRLYILRGIIELSLIETHLGNTTSGQASRHRVQAGEAISACLVTNINRSMGTLLQTDHVTVGNHVVDDLSGDANLCQSLQSNWSKTVRPNDFGCFHDGTKRVAGWGEGKGEEEEEEEEQNEPSYLEYTRRTDAFCVRLRKAQLDARREGTFNGFILSTIMAILVSFRQDRVGRQDI